MVMRIRFAINHLRYVVMRGTVEGGWKMWSATAQRH